MISIRTFISTFAILLACNLQATKINLPEDDDYHFFKNIVISRSTLSSDENSIHEKLIFTKDNDYNITLSNKDCEMKLEIKDEKGNVVASNYDPKTKTYYNAIIFQCSATQLYSVEISPKINDAHGICRIIARHHKN